MEKLSIQEVSTCKLEKWLLRDDKDREALNTINVEIDKREKIADKDWKLCNPKNEIYEGYYTLIRLFTDYNIFWRMAKIKLFKEGHPAFFETGSGKYRKILWSGFDVGMKDVEVFIKIIDTMYEICHKFEFNWAQGNRKGKGGKGKSPEEAIAHLALTSEDNQIQRYMSSLNGDDIILGRLKEE